MEEGAGGCLLDYLCTLYLFSTSYIRTMEVGNRVGLRVAPLKPGEDRTEDGDADGGTQGEEVAGAKSLFLGSRCKLPVVTFSFFPSFPCDVLGIGQTGAGGSCRGPPADYERSRRTANGKGLYLCT